jgi:rhodanese-related sulfurtransferase
VLTSLVRILIIVGVAAEAGYIRARNLPWVPDVEAIQQQENLHKWLRENRGLTLEQFQNRIAEGWLVIDARPADAFANGHLYTGSVPPVLNVPPDEIYNNVERLTQPGLAGMPVALYCTSITCDYAEELYTGMQSLGFFDIWIYFPGWEGIVEAGLETETGPDTWTSFDDPVGGFPSDEAYGESDGNVPSDPNIPTETEP